MKLEDTVRERGEGGWLEGKGGQESEVGVNVTKLSRKYHSKVHSLYNEYKLVKYPHFETEWHFHGKQ